MLAFFFASQLITQHLQIVYYTVICMGLLTLFYVIEAVRNGNIKPTVIALGLAVVAVGVGYGTSIGELALMGAITGVPVGAAQAFLLRRRVARSWVWAVAMPLLWALGWTVTAAAGIGVDRQYAVFGAFGAITFMALSGVVLDRLRAATPAAPPPQHRPATATA